MKPILAFLIILSSFNSKQESKLDNWIKSIVNDMIEMTDLDIYSDKPISPSIDINFILVESVKDITIEKGVITMLINHGKGTYCTQLKFRYIEKEDHYYLLFPEPYKNNILSQEHDFVNPWIEKTNICN